MNKAVDIPYSSRLMRISWLALFAILGMYVNSLFFIHSHVLPDSTVVIHAHPYAPGEDAGTKFPSHGHTNVEWLVYGQIFNPAFLLIAGLILAFLYRPYPQKRVILPTRIFIQPVTLLFRPDRGPPCQA
jgi:hypothetical protein